ncbi:MAG: RHS repeat-associated core domain-containing protein, partial [Pyrinomonadaceae bacterium]|nr:RHS repeat-associated core domain-containing protein [Pyrinomonadaceae bacterium]
MTVFVYNAAGKLIAEYSTQMAQVQQVSYLTNDHLGSPRVITNESGAVTTRQDFSAFGDETLTVQRTQALSYKPDELRKDYTGYEKDEETGLEFAQARYYNPKHGRFTSVDPLTASANVKDPQTFNRYSYALNSPYKFTDPLGLISEDTGANGSNCRQCIGGGFNGGTDFDLTASYKYNALYFNGEDQRGVAAAMRSRREGAAQQANSNNSASSSKDPQIQAEGVKLVGQRQKLDRDGNVIMENGLPVFEEIVLAVGEKPVGYSGEEFIIDLHPARGALLLGDEVFLKVDFVIRESGNDDRASLDFAKVANGTQLVSNEVAKTTVSENGNRMSAYVQLTAGPDGLRKGEGATLTVSARASFIDEYNSTTGRTLEPRHVWQSSRIKLINNSPNPATRFLKRPSKDDGSL